MKCILATCDLVPFPTSSELSDPTHEKVMLPNPSRRELCCKVCACIDL